MSDPNNPYGPPDPYGQSGSDSNPYGGQGGGSNPYGAPGGSSPYGQPYQPNPYGGGPAASGAAPSTDGLSVAALVLSFLCCLAPIGVILGFVGLSRTKGGRRKGRGLAIAAIVIGIVMTLVCVLIGVLIGFGVSRIVTPGNAEVGQCVNIDEDDNTVVFTKSDCSDEHDGEIVGVADITDSNVDEISERMQDYCNEIVDADDREKIFSNSGLTTKAVTENPDDVEVGDHLVCYVEGDDLTGSVR